MTSMVLGDSTLEYLTPSVNVPLHYFVFMTSNMIDNTLVQRSAIVRSMMVSYQSQLIH
jgi:hypothetical protein